MLSKENIEDVYGLSPMQMGMLLHQASHEDTTAYIEQLDFVMEGRVNAQALEQAFAKMLAKYSVLRSIFSYRKTDEPKQLVLRERETKIDVIDFSQSDLDLVQAHVDEFKASDKRKGFDISKDVLVRVSLILRPDEKSHVIFSFHHIILDGWCLGLVFGDLFQAYENALANTEITSVEKETHRYAEFIRWLDNQDSEAARNWWASAIQDYATPAGLPWFDMPGEDLEPAPKVQSFFLGEHLSQKIQGIAQEHQLTFNAIFQSAWGVLLQKFNHSHDVIFGTVVSGRPPELNGVQDMVGLFINTVPLRVKTEVETRFIDLAKNVGEQIFSASKHDYFPLYEIQQQSELKSRLINHVVAFENYPIADQMRAMSADSESLKVLDVICEEQTNYDFNLIVNPGVDTKITFSYNSNKFKADVMALLQRSLLALLNDIAENSNKFVDALTICSDEDRTTVLQQFNNTTVEYPRNASIPDLFSAQVEATPERIALTWDQGEISYADLFLKVRNVAARLQHAGVKPGDKVALFLPRSPEVMYAILGCLTAGTTYIPLDIDAPAARLEFVLQDAEASLVIGSEHYSPNLERENSLLLIEDLVLAENCPEFTFVDIPAESGAYMMYTSGSTGKAKGCSISHRNIIRLVKNTNFADFDEAVTLSSSSPVFDASTFEYWGSLLNGGRLCLFDNQYLLDAEKLKSLIISENINTMWLTAALFNQLVDADISLFAPLKQLLVGGEVLSLSCTAKVLVAHPHVQLINGYGPTENTTFSMTYRLPSPANYRIPIGKPINNSTGYVLDAGNQLLPPGAYGELCVGGDGVSSGYVNRDDLNAQAFLSNPFAEGELYRTGDIVRWLPDGNIDLQGRKDFQHKIRGYRVELGEIETAINAINGVKESIVLVNESEEAGKLLYAWFVSDSEAQDEVLIRKELLKSLPRYMLPDYLMRLEKFPLNTNGKVDRRNLPKITAKKQSSNELKTESQPRNEIETAVYSAFRDVLGITDSSFGIYDNFRDWGANSLNLITVSNRLKKALNRDIELQIFFKCSTIEAVASELAKNENTPSRSFVDLKLLTAADQYTASDSQRRIVILSKMDAEGINYNVPNTYRIDGELDVSLLENAFQRVIEKHESLRTGFDIVGGSVLQVIHTNADFSLNRKTISVDDCIESCLSSEIQPFNINEPPLVRATLYSDDTNSHHFLFVDIHHSVVDGVSMGIILSELNYFYLNPAATANPGRYQYKEFSAWLEEYLKSEGARESKEFWLSRFSDELPVLELPTDYPRPAIQNFDGAFQPFRLDRRLTAQIKNTAEKFGVTVYMLMLGSLHILLAKLSGQRDIIVGTPVASRLHPDAENMVGMFVNTLPMRARIDSMGTLKSFYDRIREESIAAFSHDDFQFDALVDLLKIPRDTGRNPIFDIMFAWENMNLGLPHFGEAVVSSHLMSKRVAKFDIDIVCIEEDGCILGFWEYATALFNQRTISRFISMHESILKQIVAPNSENVSFAELSIVPEFEKDQILNRFNDTSTNYPRNETLLSLFIQQVQLAPTAIALTSVDNLSNPPLDITLSYSLLNSRVESVASELINIGVTPGSHIGIHANRSAQYIVGILAILRVGGVYVPIDPKFPKTRKEFLVRDAEVNTILSPGDLANENISDVNTLDIDKLWVSPVAEPLAMPAIEPESPCYIMYTSGTTGTPKGVVIPHRAVIRLIVNSNLPEIYPSDRVLLTGAVGFDSVAWEIWAAFLNGASICTVDDGVLLNTAKLKQFYLDKEITVNWLTAGLFHQFAKTDREMFSPLRVLATGGDVVSPKLAEFVLESCPDIILMNGYGPTEATVFVTTERISRPISGPVSIGRPTSNARVYIVDSEFSLVPIGVKGQLCVAGDGLALSYLQNLEATAEKFIDCPFEPDRKMYLTGDIAKWTPDGKIEFSGRADRQIKLRGFRIELGEIESALLRLEQIEMAFVCLNGEGSDKTIIAYISLADSVDQTSGPIASEIKALLAEDLPDFMLPTTIICLDEIPLTINGKVNRRALPDPKEYLDEHSESSKKLNKESIPSNQVEKILAQTWQSILHIEVIKINDNFFQLGGDSIKAIQVISELAEFGLETDLPTLFKYPTIKQLAEKIKGKEQYASQEISTGEISNTPIQLWYLHGQGVDSDRYLNQGFCLNTHNRLEEDYIVRSLEALVKHHDSLRTRVKQHGSSFIQSYADLNENNFYYSFLDIEEENLEAEVSKLGLHLQESTSIEDGPMLCVGHVRCKSGDYLIIVINHIAEDAVSLRIFQQDFIKAYQQVSKNQPIHLGLKTDSYQKWSQSLKEYSHLENYEEEKAYWNSIEDKKARYLPIKSSVPRKMRAMVSKSWQLNEHQTQSVLSQSNVAFQTRTDELLLSALFKSLGQILGDGTFTIDMEGHGRESFGNGLDLSRTIGWFTCLYPVSSDSYRNWHIDDCIKSIRDMLRKVPSKGIGYGINKYLNPAHRDIPIFGGSDIVFNYLGVFDEGKNGDELVFSDLDIGPFYGASYTCDNPLVVTVKVQSDLLQIEVLFHPDEIDQAFITELGDTFIDVIRAFIKRCEVIAPPIKPDFLDVNEVYGESALSPMQHLLLKSAPLSRLGDFKAIFVYQSDKTLDPELVKKAQENLVNYHDALRSVFKKRRNEYVQFVQRSTNASRIEHSHFIINQAESNIPSKISKSLDKRLDLKNGPVFKLYQIDNGVNDTSLLIFEASHLVVDIISERILIEDFQKSYDAISKGRKAYLPEKGDSFIRWCNKLSLHFASTPQSIYSFWLREFDRGTKSTLKVKSSSKTRKSSSKLSIHKSSIEKPLFDSICFSLREAININLPQPVQISSHDILLTILAASLYKWGESSRVLFLMNNHGRNGHLLNLEINRSVGFYNSIFPFVLKYDPDNGFCENILDTYRNYEEKSQLSVYFLALAMRYPEMLSKNLDDALGFNYQGHIEERGWLKRHTEDFVEKGLIKPSESISGKTKLSFSVRSVEEELIVEVQYLESAYTQVDISNLQNTIKQQIEQLSKQYPVENLNTSLTVYEKA